MKHIAILGSFSGRNKGDLAILRSQLIQLKRRAREKLTVYIFTKDIARMREYLSDIITDETDTSKVNIKILRSLTVCIGLGTLPVLAICDKVIVGGGGLFFDTKLFDIFVSQLLNLFIITLLLKLLGKNFMIYAAGCSNLNSKASRYMAKVVLNNAKVITARDELSRNTFRRWARGEVVLGADSAFSLEPLESKRVNTIAQSWPKGKKILLSLHKFMFVVKDLTDRKNVLKQFLTQVGEFANQNGYEVLTYTNHTNQRFALEISELCGKVTRPVLPSENHLLPEELIYLFSKVDFVIATQMHACMFAYLANVPFVSIMYAEKVEEFNRLVGNSNVLQPADMGNQQKVKQCLVTAAAGESLRPNQAINAKVEKIFGLLMNFIGNNS